MKPYVGVLFAVMPVSAFGCRQLFSVDHLIPEATLRFTLSEGATIELAQALFPDGKDGVKRNKVFEAFAEEPSLMVAIPFCVNHTKEYLLSKLASPQGDVLSAVVPDLGEMGTAVPSACDLVCEVKPNQFELIVEIVELHAGYRNMPPAFYQHSLDAISLLCNTSFSQTVA